MAARTKPPFRADHVGSFLRPKELLDARERQAKGEISKQDLRKAEDASIIFVSSGVVKQSRPYWGAYAVAKCGLESVRSLWAEELDGEANIRVNSVNPGRMRTAMRAAAYPAEDPNTVPTPESVSGTFLYLLSARGRGIDGLFIDAQ